MIQPLLLVVLVSTASITEPSTGVAFETTLTVSNQSLALTGTGVRRALGQNAYAVAHYIATAGEERLAPPATVERLDQFINASAYKAIVFHGVYKSVPAQGIRHSWRKHFKELGEKPREDFIETFKSPFARGERLQFLATPEGHLEVRHDGRLIGQWTDASLVDSVWRMCLGPTTEIVDRTQLSAREWVPNPSAKNETEKETATP